MKPEEMFEVLRLANGHLVEFFARYSGVSVCGSSDDVEAMLGVERVLRSVAPVLKGFHCKLISPELSAEIDRYRVNLLRLRQELAAMQESAADTRTRLADRHRHLQAAMAWTSATRATT